MSSMFDGIEAASLPAAKVCGVSRVREKLTPEDAAGLDRALANRDVPGSAIARVLKDAGHAVQPPAVNRHRRGDCLCAA